MDAFVAPRRIPGSATTPSEDRAAAFGMNSRTRAPPLPAFPDLAWLAAPPLVPKSKELLDLNPNVTRHRAHRRCARRRAASRHRRALLLRAQLLRVDLCGAHCFCPALPRAGRPPSPTPPLRARGGAVAARRRSALATGGSRRPASPASVAALALRRGRRDLLDALDEALVHQGIDHGGPLNAAAHPWKPLLHAAAAARKRAGGRWGSEPGSAESALIARTARRAHRRLTRYAVAAGPDEPGRAPRFRPTCAQV